MNKIRFEFLDGIRGLAAIWVVLYHSMLFNGYTESIIWSNNIFINCLQKPLSIGRLAVSIFIVLSGFCLAIPVVNNNLQLKGGFNRYIKRRAKRLIPPYYAALALSIGLIYLFPILNTPFDTAWDSKIPITFGAVLSHLLLVHNLNTDWIFKLNGAHWSIATEWQIYWFFPLMLILWRKVNLYFSFFIILVLAVILFKIVPLAAPEFLVLFFMGVICCYFSFKAGSIKRINLPLSMIALLVCLTAFIIKKTSPLI
ncbi:acyltransferase family protein [Sphingobacterium siyangense]|uniref:acyltransferase family protein n=1 Tax=Sphingobacterium siyangense TaxID=459529 RepID=UPI003DA3E1C0